MYWILVLSGISALTAWLYGCLWVACIGVILSSRSGHEIKGIRHFSDETKTRIWIWKFKCIVASYQYELNVMWTIWICRPLLMAYVQVFFRERCKTLSTGTNSLDLYLRFVLNSFRRWKRLFYTLIVCLKLSCGRYLSLIFYVFRLNDALTFVSPSQYNVAVMFGQCMKLILMLKRNVVNASIWSLIVITIERN